MPWFFNGLTRSAWAGYAFAVAATGAAIVFRWEIGQLTGQWIPLSLCGLAVVLASLRWAGSGPGLAAVTLTMAWYVWASRGPGEWIHYLLYASAAGLIYVAGPAQEPRPQPGG